MNTWTKPELLSPAGDLEKLKTACLYGADAVYLSGQKFGLRYASDNFTLYELEKAVKYAHARNVSVYVTLNGYLLNKDIEALPEFLKELERLKVDALLISDLGVFTLAANHTKIPIHVSTQASCANAHHASFWKHLGATRIVLARETAIHEAKQIKLHSNIELEMFIHGSMCMAWSGQCVISNFTRGRDSNRGGCNYACRFPFELQQSEQSAQRSFMSSRDLNGLDLLPQFFKARIDSLKIEGRMKSLFYLAQLTKIYRTAIDSFHQDEMTDFSNFKRDLEAIQNRGYTTASLENRADFSSVAPSADNHTIPSDQNHYIGEVVDVVDGRTLVKIKNPFSLPCNVELLTFRGPNETHYVQKVYDIKGSDVQHIKPNMFIWIDHFNEARPLNILRKSYCAS